MISLIMKWNFFGSLSRFEIAWQFGIFLSLGQDLLRYDSRHL
ncbi:hypothetical protein LEP1GSC057_3682 [Leptospira interrogans str. Brem 329]|nr:hypothetical protein LEP1GSC057_3682 [Leptospira interrogans str. Brem 329]